MTILLWPHKPFIGIMGSPLKRRAALITLGVPIALLWATEVALLYAARVAFQTCAGIFHVGKVLFWDTPIAWGRCWRGERSR